jgi:hypothetical protein
MTVYIIRGEVVTARSSAPAKISPGEVVVGSAAEIAASALSLGQMVAVWNALPGTTAISQFKDRKTAAQRLWTAFTRLPIAPEPIAGAIKPFAGVDSAAPDRGFGCHALSPKKRGPDQRAPVIRRATADSER